MPVDGGAIAINPTPVRRKPDLVAKGQVFPSLRGTSNLGRDRPRGHIVFYERRRIALNVIGIDRFSVRVQTAAFHVATGEIGLNARSNFDRAGIQSIVVVTTLGWYQVHPIGS